MLTNALKVCALRESLHNQAIRDAVKDIDAWRETQTEAMMNDLVNSITCPDPDFQSLAHNVGNLDPHIAAWVTSIRTPLRKAAIQMVAQEMVEDCVIPHAHKFLKGEWMRKQSEIELEIRKRSTQHEEELRRLAEEYAQCLEQELRENIEKTISALKTQLDEKLADDIAQLKNHVKVSLQATKNEAESHMMTLAIRTPKAAKPSPLSITHPKKTKKKVTILNLTTAPPPGNEALASDHTDMETDADSTPTTPIYQSSAPSPAPLLTTAPDTVNTDVADPNSIPRWAQTPSSDEKTPHAPTFPITNTLPANSELSAVLAALTGMRTEVIARIDKVNACVDLVTGPQTIPEYTIWNNENTAAWEHPGYVDPLHDDTMNTLADQNSACEVDRLQAERNFHQLHD